MAGLQPTDIFGGGGKMMQLFAVPNKCIRLGKFRGGGNCPISPLWLRAWRVVKLSDTSLVWMLGYIYSLMVLFQS